MEPEDYEVFMRPWADDPPEMRNVGFGQLAGLYLTQPLSEWEKEIASDNLAKAKAEGLRWYHAGLAGRSVGDRLLPARVTGLDPRGFGNAIPARRQHVYMAHRRSAVTVFAHGNELRGSASRVYEVAPVGPITVDPEGLRRGIMYDLDRETDPRWPEARDACFSYHRCNFARVTAVHKVREQDVRELLGHDG